MFVCVCVYVHNNNRTIIIVPNATGGVQPVAGQ